MSLVPQAQIGADIISHACILPSLLATLPSNIMQQVYSTATRPHDKRGIRKHPTPAAPLIGTSLAKNHQPDTGSLLLLYTV